MSFCEVRFMFALIPYFCLLVSVVWHSCSMWVIVNGWLLQWVQVGGAVFKFFVHVSWYDRVLRRVIISPPFLLLKFGVCWWKYWILLCSWVLLVVFHVLFHSSFAMDYLVVAGDWKKGIAIVSKWGNCGFFYCCIGFFISFYSLMSWNPDDCGIC